MALMTFVFVRSRPARNTCPDRDATAELLALVGRGRGQQLAHEPCALGRHLPPVVLWCIGVGEVAHPLHGDERDLRVGAPRGRMDVPLVRAARPEALAQHAEGAEEGSYGLARRLGRREPVHHPGDAAIERSGQLAVGLAPCG